MGCDIHLMVEYDVAWAHGTSHRASDPLCAVPFGPGADPLALSCGVIGIARNYVLFAALAGVRNAGGVLPLFPPRGIPSNCSGAVFSQFHLHVQDRGKDERLRQRGIWRDEAKALVDKGGAIALGVRETGDPEAITDPAYHCASWLTRCEILDDLRHADFDPADLCVGFRIVLDALRTLDDEYGAGHSRIVFAFDS
ncbi:MAG TPA: hypothetical protein VN153_10150 [Tahibacter sp.]|nr:hypothetical protein [Tahibacter sp.]